MTVFEHWEKQRDGLRPELEKQEDLTGAVYQMRHAITQVEQNALAEMEDEVLRQQAGVLLGCVKSALSFTEVNVVHQTWVAQKAEAIREEKKSPLPWIAAALLLAVLLLSFFQKNLPILILAAAGLGLGIYLYLKPRPQAAPLPPDTVHVTVKPDVDKMLMEMDRQIRMVDRSLNDFRYLNEQNGKNMSQADEGSVAKASDLMEAIWETEEESRESAEEAASKLLHQLGLTPLSYSPENQKYFNILPGKQITRTLTPALISTEDGHLLRRGTAVVCERVAQ